MDTINAFLQFSWIKFLLPVGVLVITLMVGWISKRFLFRSLRQWAAKTQTRTDDILVQAFSGPFMIWVLILGLHLATQTSDLPDRITGLIGKSLLILWVISLTLVASRLVANLVKHFGNEMQGALPVTSLTQNLARIGVMTIGMLILLNQLGVSITPILTALGVGGLAVALALQDTLSNLFAGFYISLAGNIRPGDYIKLDSGEEGYVTDITWRSTTIRALPNNLIIVPNAKLAQAIVTNYYLPEKRMSLQLPISVSYDNDPDEIERILIEEAKKGAQDIPGLLAEPAPLVRFIPGFGDSSLNFTLICQVAEFTDQYLAQHELRKRIFKRFREEGIEIPFPIRTVYLRDHSTNGKMTTNEQTY
ncbi:MAG: mechanosensitive ion channel family protein [candidate division KSB1 bacterium]|nr:mechanosensitive ion channel family protein [candidate division KSB1 bacterium]MDZ7301218.1 mechanosensitive ion channel family protein [candidate division KSB1 bacterium]MDZ7310558.1 mechanosensitive ion channel family protein [candidate division KSB1 bacterium]